MPVPHLARDRAREAETRDRGPGGVLGAAEAAAENQGTRHRRHARGARRKTAPGSGQKLGFLGYHRHKKKR